MNSSTYTVRLDLLIDPQERTVICPRCGHNYSHIAEVFTRLGVDPHEGGRAYTGTAAKGVVANERRDCLVIKFRGECGHFFEWQIQQHKGYNFAQAVYTGRDEDFDWTAEDLEIDEEKKRLRSVLLGERTPLEILEDGSFSGFAVDKHQHIFERMCDLYRNGQAIDRITLANELMKYGELELSGGLAYLVDLE